jgi:hypothetical protein
VKSLEKAFESWARHEAERIKRRVARWTPEQWEKFYLVNPKLRPIKAGLGGKPREDA